LIRTCPPPTRLAITAGQGDGLVLVPILFCFVLTTILALTALNWQKLNFVWRLALVVAITLGAAYAVLRWFASQITIYIG
jgi:hypothetical protein